MRKPLFTNEHVFDTITEESAYWIGFLMADGCITKSKNNITLALQIEDEEHIQKFKSFLDCNNKIYKTPNFHRISITSEYLVKKFMDYNLTEKKTFSASSPLILVNNRHYWRGTIDGDGCITTHKCGTPYIQLVGTREICEQFLFFVENLFGKTKSNVRPTKSIYVVTIGGTIALKTLKNLYENSYTFLDRKKYKALEILKNYGKEIKGRAKVTDTEKMNILFDIKNKQKTREEICNTYSIKRTTYYFYKNLL